jgi:hypothetical protein
MFDLLVKIACFVKKKKILSLLKAPGANVIKLFVRILRIIVQS